MIYFIRPVGMDGPIKIGCTMSLDYRIDTLETWSPFKLEVIALLDGDTYLERNIHECFSDFHSHKEWFHPGERLLDFIEKIRDGVPAHEATNLRHRLGPIRRIGIHPRKIAADLRRAAKQEAAQ